MRKLIQKLLDIRNNKNLQYIRESFIRRMTKNHLLILGSVSVFIVIIVSAVTLPKIMAATMQSGDGAKSDVKAVSISDNTSPDGDPGTLVPTLAPTSVPTSTPSPTPTPDPTLQKGDENERVQQLQNRLMDLNYLDLDESTQYFGPATQYAVQLFQRQHDLAQDGIAGPATLNLLYSDSAK